MFKTSEPIPPSTKLSGALTFMGVFHEKSPVHILKTLRFFSLKWDADLRRSRLVRITDKFFKKTTQLFRPWTRV